MRLTQLTILFLLTVFSNNTMAYGSSSSSKKACDKPRFTDFSPAHLTEVQPRSDFSFLISASANPETIEVKVKKQPVDVVVKPINGGYSVSGKLPESLQDTYARIDIKATGANKCKGSDGWLLKIK